MFIISHTRLIALLILGLHCRIFKTFRKNNHRINELARNSENKNTRELYRGISEFTKGYQPTTNVVEEEKGDLVAHCHSILTRWRNYFSQLLNVLRDNDISQTEIHTAEPLVPETSAFEVKMAIEKLKRHRSPGIVHIPAELITTGGSKICSEIHKLTDYLEWRGIAWLVEGVNHRTCL